MAKAPPTQRLQRRTLPPARRPRVRALRAGTTCTRALQTIIQNCVGVLERHQDATCCGNTAALHEMRIALTRLRTALLFFAPAIDTSKVGRLRREAAWLNGKLGAARDLDVSLQRKHGNDTHPKRVGHWKAERQRRYAQVQRTLRTQRYHQLVATLRAWTAEQVAGQPASQRAGIFSTERLGEWQEKLLRRARELDRLGPRKRHKLRIRTKRFRYALEWSLKLSPPKEVQARKAMIAHAKTIQEALGKLNDANQHRAVAKAQHLKPLPGMSKLETPKTQKRLLKKATNAFRELGRHPLA